ncbi:MAG: SAM-dependent chlorinase/fluorinase [Hydrogenophilales bacterium]|nr:SAM-dependent chlorinase/fluorinase [Hydrogenophilales bacterium]
MIVLFTDFGADDIYVGQVKAVLTQTAPAASAIDLLHSAPNFDIESSAHLLAALYLRFSPGSVFIAVVDPGVGGARDAVVMVADGYWFVGPDNGLLSVVAARAQAARLWRITWRPERLSPSFHGRDLFAPIAAWIAAGLFPADKLAESSALQVQSNGADSQRVIYIDHYGNCMTGMRAAGLGSDAMLQVAGRELRRASTFSEAMPDEAFWHENSVGLVEIAVNQGSAAHSLGLQVGSVIAKPK